MASMQKYVVTQPFTISFGKKESVTVSSGDVIMFDGVNFQVGQQATGTSTSLKSVIAAGEWVTLVAEDDQSDGSGVELHPKPVVTPSRTYNATGGQQVEMSDPGNERDLGQGRRHGQGSEKNLSAVVEAYEKQAEQTAPIIVSNDEEDIKKEVKVMYPDVREVSKVSDSALKAAQTSSGVVSLREETPTTKAKVVQGVRMAKQTAPTQVAGSYKHISVDAQATGTVVAPVSDRSDETMLKQATTSAPARAKVVRHQTIAKKTGYKAPQRIDIGSSTKAAVVQHGDTAAEVSVVGQVKESSEVLSKEGIKSTLSVGAEQGISAGPVTTGSADGGVELASSDDLDVSDILDNA